ncbi:MAG: hypothetical protein J0H66_01770 [Solirubrobacterales bacterium]|nr:hypothetical protein [Solirubrobacterales bacterium]OJU95412.1 MAG: hypothetical protein BGO23_06105 [Solirubrobacterales bacterium 67-14]
MPNLESPTPKSPTLNRCLAFLLALFGAGLLIGAGTAAASSGSIVYVKDYDVWIANADGSGQHQVTKNGTADSPWRSPSQADDGTIAASHNDQIVRMKQNGTVLNAINPPPLKNSVSHMVDGVPVKVAISPNGKLITWAFATYECPVGVSCGARTVTGYTAADRLTDPSKYGSTFFTDPSWIGNSRTLQSGGYGSQVNIHDLGKGEPVHWFDDSDYAENDTDLSDAELAPDGSRLAAVRGYGNSTHIIWYTVSGNAKQGPPPAVPTPECLTGELEGLGGPTWAPDSKSLAWEEPDGVWLKANIGGACDSPQPKLLIPGGSEPDWGPAKVNPGPRVDDPISVRQLSLKLKPSLKRGVSFRVKTLGAGPVKLQILRGKAVVAAGNAKATKAGWTKVTAKFTRAGKKKLAKAKKANLTARFRADGRTGDLAFKLK